jgi:hypothetical protein
VPKDQDSIYPSIAGGKSLIADEKCIAVFVMTRGEKTIAMSHGILAMTHTCQEARTQSKVRKGKDLGTDLR